MTIASCKLANRITASGVSLPLATKNLSSDISAAFERSAPADPTIVVIVIPRIAGADIGAESGCRYRCRYFVAGADICIFFYVPVPGAGAGQTQPAPKVPIPAPFAKGAGKGAGAGAGAGQTQPATKVPIPAPFAKAAGAGAGAGQTQRHFLPRCPFFLMVF